MTIIETKLKRWGNSFGIIIPSEEIRQNNIEENDDIRILIIKDSKKVLKKTFGLLKGKLTKPTQQIKDELRRDLY